jgi:hypothetical protein
MDYQCSKCIIDHSTHKILYADQTLEFWKQKKVLQVLNTYLNELKELQSSINNSLENLMKDFITNIDTIQKDLDAKSKDFEDKDVILNVINDFYSNSKTMSQGIKKDISKECEKSDKIITTTLNSIIKSLSNFLQVKDYSEYLDDLSLTIHSFLPGTKKLAFYNITAQKQFTIDMNIDFNIPYYSDSLCINNRIFLFVGSESNDPSILYELNKKLFCMVSIAKMLTVKIAHSVVNNMQAIYSIGGWNLENNCINKCEKFDIAKQAFMMIPSLNEARACPGLVFSASYLYCIGGRTDGDMKLARVEKLNITVEKEWEYIDIIDTNILWTPRSSHKCVSVNGDQFFLIGGYDSRDLLLSDCLVCSADDKQLIIKDKLRLAIADSFYWSSTPVKSAHHTYIVSANRNIHIFSEDKKSWDVTKKINWVIS